MQGDAYEMLGYLHAKEDIGLVTIIWSEIGWNFFELHLKVGIHTWERVIKPELKRFVPEAYGDRLDLNDGPDIQRIFLYNRRGLNYYLRGGTTPLDDL